MRIIVDCSVAVSWFLKDESHPNSEDILKKALTEGMLVPSLFYFELANVIKNAFLKKRISSEGVQDIPRLLSKIPIQVEEIQPATFFLEIIDSAVSQHLSVYDASYLVLARVHRAPLATFDSTLQKAARELGLEVLS